jgi:hypothetical protein
MSEIDLSQVASARVRDAAQAARDHGTITYITLGSQQVAAIVPVFAAYIIEQADEQAVTAMTKWIEATS